MKKINAEDHLLLAYKVAHEFRYLQPKYSIDELISTALLGLVKASRNYDETKGFAFSTYAMEVCRGNIKVMVRDDKWHRTRNGDKIFMNSLNSLTSRETGDKETEYIDIFEDENDLEEKSLNSILLQQLLNYLNEKQRQAVQLYYFKDKKQDEISKIMGCTQVSVSRWLKQSLKIMRRYIDGDLD